MPPQQLSPAIQQLFNPVAPGLGKNPQLAANSAVGKGDLILFNYTSFVHDPYPLVIVTDYVPGKRLRGVNLHYLTFNYIRTLIMQSATNPMFSYSNIKGEEYIISAFRTYKWQAIRQIRKLDSSFLMRLMSIVRSFDPNEIKSMREAVDQQIAAQMNPKAQASVPQQQSPQQVNQTPAQPM